MLQARVPESVRAIADHINVADFDFEGAVLRLPLPHIPALVNELARISLARAKQVAGTGRADVGKAGLS